MNEIVEIHRQRCFSLEEATALLPLVYRLTEQADQDVRKLSQRLRTIGDPKSALGRAIENEIETLIETWQGKLLRLGVSSKGLWLADFDKGDGYWCWKFPETSIQHYHGYQDGFTGRRKIAVAGATENEADHENCDRADQSQSWGLQGE